METIRDAIATGARAIYLNNGTQIIHLDHGQTWEAVCPPKIINGKRVYRWICCKITCTTGMMVGKEILKPYAMDYLGLDYIVPEKMLNLFIHLNGGIDEYRTDYWCKGWMYY